MAFKKASVVQFPGLKDIVDKLVNEYSIALEEVQSDRILYLKSDARSKRAAKITAIKVPHPSVTSFRFALTIYEQRWSDLDEARKVLHVLRELLRISDFEEAKVSGYELQDFPVIVEKYGATWEDNEDLPNPLDKEIETEELEEDNGPIQL